MTLAGELRTIIDGEVDDSKETLEVYSRDASLFVLKPQVVVRPKGVSDVQKLVSFVQKEREKGRNISLTPRAAGTDMSGGPLGDSIIVDMLPHFNTLIEIGEDYAVVEPGMYFKDFDRETQKHELELPSYTASRDINTVGGMAANDSGGEKNLKYGKTAEYVEELEVVLADGKVHTLKNLIGEELEHALQQDGYIGDVYRNIARIVREKREVIMRAKPEVSKNSAGYALWDIGDGETSLDLARLFVGSQGTMGIITKIKYRLIKPKKKGSMVVVFVEDLNELGALIPKILHHHPDSFESYDDNTFMLAAKYFPEFAVQMKANIISLGFSFLPEVWRLLTSGIPKLVLLVEFKAETQMQALSKAKRLQVELLTEKNKNLSVLLAKNEKEARKYWVVRHESFNLLRKKVRGKRTAPFIEDFVVPPETLPKFLPRLNNILKEYNLTYTIAGHVGDGNFHIIPLMDPDRKDGVQLVEELSHRVYDLVLEYHGSITGEHNDGFARTPFLEKMFGKDMMRLFDEVEKTLDPLDIFNPGKKVERGGSKAFSYLDLPKSGEMA